MFFFCLFFLNGEPRDADLIVLLLLWSTMIIKSSWILNHSRFAHSGFRRLDLLSDSNARCPYMQQIPLIVLNARYSSKVLGGHVACSFSIDAFRVCFFVLCFVLFSVAIWFSLWTKATSLGLRKKKFPGSIFRPMVAQNCTSAKKRKKSCRQPKFKDAHHVKSQSSLHHSDYFTPGLSAKQVSKLFFLCF